MIPYHEGEGAELQANVRYMDVGQEAKWTVGARLRFVGFSKDEPKNGCRLRPGDLLEVLPENPCGMGIDVVRLPSRQYKTMVWPEEVEIVAARRQGTEQGRLW